ncbi:MAG TPA: cupin domain-containing protein [Dinghuibacter sp.]|uniref:cupin domain-containing protein n=1 Tax=Dinghuibacter sp. TaxID=2024697 RepID=UPI002BF975E7|nr:cupin domain-containing protein [Dinghuibacter sp.]HTJ10818.1 cupin domain-containing protein [Dinghuibacter sp.]
MIRAYWLYTGPDGESHVKKGHIDESALTAVKAIHFKETPAHGTLEWHNAPVEQYVITLSGVLEFGTRGGETFTLHPGDVLIATDVTGGGHSWQLTGDEPWRRAYVVFADGAEPAIVLNDPGS